MSPDGGIGRRGGFKIRFRKEWEFESPSGHHIAVSESLYQPLRPKETGHLAGFFCACLFSYYSPISPRARQRLARRLSANPSLKQKPSCLHKTGRVGRPEGVKKRWNIPAHTMTGDFGKDVLGPLVDMGRRLAGSRSGRNAGNDLQSYLGGFDSAQRARLVALGLA